MNRKIKFSKYDEPCQRVREMKKAIVFFSTVLSWSFAIAADVSETHPAAISFVGFYSSETVEFRPERIGYGAMINFRQAHDALRSVLEVDGFSVNVIGEFEKGFRNFDEEDSNLLRQTIGELQSATNEYLKSGGRSNLTCSKLRFPTISKYSAYPNWDDNSQIFVFIGLETLSPSGKGMRSGLAAVLFNGNGACSGASAVEYNFTNYNTSQFIADCKRLIAGVSK